MLLDDDEAEIAYPNDLEKNREKKETGSRPNSSIKVNASRFDELMNFSGELMISRARMEERHARLEQLAEMLEKEAARQGHREDDGLATVVRKARSLVQLNVRDMMDFGNLADGITDAMKKVRMVSLGLTEREWREVIRKAAHTADKEVVVSISTGTIELDKRVLDELRDPMMHLLRNAVDHGIESRIERLEAGKPESGRIEIEASVQGAMVQIQVRDDGAGIDLAKIRKVAIDSGLVDRNDIDLLEDDALYDFLFHPGFTTAREVSALSGRGVGLDVVRTRIEAFGGQVRVYSPPGNRGTTFVISVPLSVLSTVGLYVGSGNTTYALPLDYVLRTVRVREGEIAQMDGQPVLTQAGFDPIRLARLSDLVKMPGEPLEKPDKVIVLSRSNLLLGVMVDHIEGHYEFVTQSMPWNLIHSPGINGASPRPDGSVVVVLDVPYLFDQACTVTKKSVLKSVRPSLTSSRTKRVLVVDDSLTSRTLEKNILLEAGYQVDVAADGEAGWKRLKQESYDLLVSDVDMPRLNGFELTRHVRSEKQLRDLPVILVTCKNKPEDRAAGAAAGADEFVVKGTFDQQSLLEIISKYL
jgi:two-component system chemotaxis sensor kinase CheA